MKFLRFSIPILLSSCLMLFSFNASATVASDVIDKKPISEIIVNALELNISLDDLFKQLQQADESQIASAVSYIIDNNLGSALETLTSALAAIPAFRKGAVLKEGDLDPEVKEIILAAVESGISDTDLPTAILTGGADPSIGSAATAAGPTATGGTQAVVGGAPPAGTTTLSTPGVSGVTGSAGGGSASPI